MNSAQTNTSLDDNNDVMSASNASTSLTNERNDDVKQNNSHHDRYAHGRPLNHQTFCSVDDVIKALEKPWHVLQEIPTGPKNDVMFIVDQKGFQHEHSKDLQYWDDCGQWEHKQRTVFSYFLCRKNEPRKSILKRKDGYHFRIQENNKFKYVLIDPQPPLTDILILRRHYSTLKGNTNYKRKITLIRNVPAHLNFQSLALNYALVEYEGQNKTVLPHGNGGVKLLRRYQKSNRYIN